MNYDEIMNSRYSATPLPESTGDEGVDKEKIVQWFLEIAFFRDFMYRNPAGKEKGKELCDALVIYDDVIIVVQVKTHDSSKPVEKWIKKELPIALNQLKGSYRMIKKQIVTKFENEMLKTQIEIDPEKQKFIHGIVILACETDKIDPLLYVDQRDIPNFAYNIYTLNDLDLILRRFDTPGDFFSYYDLRFWGRNIIKPKLHDEENTMIKMIPILPKLLGESLSKMTPEKQEKILLHWKRKLTSDANTLENYKYSLLIDDIIARVHEIDTELYAADEKGLIQTQRIAEFFGYVDRARRIALGLRMYECARDAIDGNAHWFPHCQISAQRTFVYLYSNEKREERIKFLQVLAISAQRKYKIPKVLGIGTNSLNQGGRAYDFVLIEKNLPEDESKSLEDIEDLLNKPDTPLL